MSRASYTTCSSCGIENSSSSSSSSTASNINSKCPIDNIQIANEDLQNLKSMVFDKELELCSVISDRYNGNNVFNLEVNPEKMKVGDREKYTDHKGLIKIRGLCNLGGKYYIQIHSHPAKNPYKTDDEIKKLSQTGEIYINPSRPFPSMEDIRTVIKHYDKICHSIIVTSWGLWFITNIDKGKNFYKTKDKEGKIDELSKRINQVLITFHKIYDRTRTTYKYIPIEKYIDIIDKVNVDLSNELNLIIKFFPWTVLQSGNNGVLIRIPIQ